jgi:hypothetical protein
VKQASKTSPRVSSPARGIAHAADQIGLKQASGGAPPAQRTQALDRRSSLFAAPQERRPCPGHVHRATANVNNSGFFRDHVVNPLRCQAIGMRAGF